MQDLARAMFSEYKILVHHTADLQLAVKMHLIDLGGKLVSAGLITPDQYQTIRNRCTPLEERAADLVYFVQVRVQQDPKFYHIFVAILKENYSLYYGIVEKLDLQARNRHPSRDRATSSGEYETIKYHTADLQLAVKMDLIYLGGELVSAGLITPDQNREIRNHCTPLEERAADLVYFVQVRVQQHPRYYHDFISVLEKNYSLYGGKFTVEKLHETYTYYGKSSANNHTDSEEYASNGGIANGGHWWLRKTDTEVCPEPWQRIFFSYIGLVLYSHSYYFMGT